MAQIVGFALIAVLLCGSGGSGLAAEFRFADIDAKCDKLRGEAVCAKLALEGVIKPGDGTKLLNEISRVETALAKNGLKGRVSLIFLESPGGSMAEAMAIGRLLRQRQIWTQVAMDDTCASACVLILAGGVARIPSGSVEIHSFYSPEILGTNDFAKAEKFYKQMADEVAVYLREMRVSSLLLEEMMRVPHFKARRLEVEELEKLGLLGIDPVYAQTRGKKR